MQRKHKTGGTCGYIHNFKKKYINWEIIAGGDLHPLQMYDVVYDKVDMKIRGLVQK